MKEPKLIREIMADMAMNPSDQTGRILRKCPYIQIELLKQKRISLDDLTDEEIDKLVEYSFLEDWIDAQDVMQALHISSRTLQTLRSNGTLPYSRIGNKIYYLKQDITKILSDNYTLNKIRNYGK
ncbi:MAG: hypothetical protein EZS26_000539 [Candidatus Ordinivivax streblomastigis]|uniref:Helix-turn-helix domain-containing protein n=1 Tax=Candidatus Ordinivivax streblomastigis TaxID=2540710 RepID=A0A5M8P4G0_9BACT|nr:MAG: hypothetical protein EZS26_000428 [Candidatus Ordinivivax streblomastigis]KAA6303379.1 MAG: hypothetical protein EZS26_000539 [Candidatus Ordinivivax streblomastigis]